MRTIQVFVALLLALPAARDVAAGRKDRDNRGFGSNARLREKNRQKLKLTRQRLVRDALNAPEKAIIDEAPLSITAPPEAPSAKEPAAEKLHSEGPQPPMSPFMRQMQAFKDEAEAQKANPPERVQRLKDSPLGSSLPEPKQPEQKQPERIKVPPPAKPQAAFHEKSPASSTSDIAAARAQLHELKARIDKHSTVVEKAERERSQAAHSVAEAQRSAEAAERELSTSRSARAKVKSELTEAEDERLEVQAQRSVVRTTRYPSERRRRWWDWTAPMRMMWNVFETEVNKLAFHLYKQREDFSHHDEQQARRDYERAIAQLEAEKTEELSRREQELEARITELRRSLLGADHRLSKAEQAAQAARNAAREAKQRHEAAERWHGEAAAELARIKNELPKAEGKVRQSLKKEVFATLEQADRYTQTQTQTPIGRKWQLKAFSTQKQGESPESNGDRVSIDLNKRRIAVADGFTLGAHTAEWAALVVHAFTGVLARVGEQMPTIENLPVPGDLASLTRMLTPIHEIWSRLSTSSFITQYVNSEVGGGTTLLGVSLDPGPEGRWRWRASGAGDTNLFIFREGKLKLAWPIHDPADFGMEPNALSFMLDTNKEDAWKQIDHGSARDHEGQPIGELQPGDHLFLVTDALAKTILQHLAAGQPIYQQLAEVQHAEQFEQLVGKLRKKARAVPTMGDDDTTMACLRVPAREAQPADKNARKGGAR